MNQEQLEQHLTGLRRNRPAMFLLTSAVTTLLMFGLFSSLSPPPGLMQRSVAALGAGIVLGAGITLIVSRRSRHESDEP